MTNFITAAANMGSYQSRKVALDKMDAMHPNATMAHFRERSMPEACGCRPGRFGPPGNVLHSWAPATYRDDDATSSASVAVSAGGGSSTGTGIPKSKNSMVKITTSGVLPIPSSGAATVTS